MNAYESKSEPWSISELGPVTVADSPDLHHRIYCKGRTHTPTGNNITTPDDWACGDCKLEKNHRSMIHVLSYSVLQERSNWRPLPRFQKFTKSWVAKSLNMCSSDRWTIHIFFIAKNKLLKLRSVINLNFTHARSPILMTSKDPAACNREGAVHISVEGDCAYSDRRDVIIFLHSTSDPLLRTELYICCLSKFYEMCVFKEETTVERAPSMWLLQISKRKVRKPWTMRKRW